MKNNKLVNTKNLSKYEVLIDGMEESEEILSLQQRQLLRRILYTHARIDRVIETTIQHRIQGMLDATELTYFGPSLYLSIAIPTLLEKMDFRRKLDSALELGSITKDDHSKIVQLNDLRNKFAHPNKSRLGRFSTEAGYLDAINILANALVAMGLVTIKES